MSRVRILDDSLSPPWWGTNHKPQKDLLPPRENHLCVPTKLCISFIALRSIPEFAKGVKSLPPGSLFTVVVESSWSGSMQGLYLLHQMSGLGHPECPHCHQRWDEAKALGFHEAREILRASHGWPPQFAFADAGEGGL